MRKYVVCPFLSDFDDMKGSAIGSFSPVSDSGYVLASNVRIKDIQASAIMKSSGEIVILISESMRLCGPYGKGFSFVDNNPLNNEVEVKLKSVDIHQQPLGSK